VHLEYKSREHGTKLVNREWVVAFHQHMPTPLAHPNYEKFDLEIGRRLPLAKHLEDSLLGVLILDRRTLRAFEPAGVIGYSALVYTRVDRQRSEKRSDYRLKAIRLVVLKTVASLLDLVDPKAWVKILQFSCRFKGNNAVVPNN
jgi:hypothetical protein